MAKKKAVKKSTYSFPKLKAEIKREIDAINKETTTYLKHALDVVKHNPKGNGISRIKRRVHDIAKNMDELERFYHDLSKVR